MSCVQHTALFTWEVGVADVDLELGTSPPGARPRRPRQERRHFI